MMTDTDHIKDGQWAMSTGCLREDSPGHEIPSAPPNMSGSHVTFTGSSSAEKLLWFCYPQEDFYFYSPSRLVLEGLISHSHCFDRVSFHATNSQLRWSGVFTTIYKYKSWNVACFIVKKQVKLVKSYGVFLCLFVFKQDDTYSCISN